MGKHFYINRSIDGHPICFNDGPNEAIMSKKEILSCLNYLYDLGKWISVDEQPHPLGVDFIGYYGNSYIKRVNVVYFEASRELNITHWMPLPSHP